MGRFITALLYLLIASLTLGTFSGSTSYARERSELSSPLSTKLVEYVRSMDELKPLFEWARKNGYEVFIVGGTARRLAGKILDGSADRSGSIATGIRLEQLMYHGFNDYDLSMSDEAYSALQKTSLPFKSWDVIPASRFSYMIDSGIVTIDAVSISDRRVVDPYGALNDLTEGKLRLHFNVSHRADIALAGVMMPAVGLKSLRISKELGVVLDESDQSLLRRGMAASNSNQLPFNLRMRRDYKHLKELDKLFTLYADADTFAEDLVKTGLDRFLIERGYNIQPTPVPDLSNILSAHFYKKLFEAQSRFGAQFRNVCLRLLIRHFDSKGR